MWLIRKHIRCSLTSWSVYIFASITCLAHGHVLDVKTIDAPINLLYYGNFLYDNIIFLLPTTTKAASVKLHELFKHTFELFDAQNKNIMIVADQTVTPFARRLANEFGVDFDSQGSHILDGASFNKEILATEILSESEQIFSKTKGIVYSGIGLHLDAKNHQVFPILKPNINALALDENHTLTGEGINTVLIAGYQVQLTHRISIGT